MKEKIIKGYMALNMNMTSRDDILEDEYMTYELEKWYHKDNIISGEEGFYFYEELVYNLLNYTYGKCRFFEIEAKNIVEQQGEITAGLELFTQNIASDIKLVREISKEEFDECFSKNVKKLAENENYYIRELVAKNPKTPVSILEKLANDKEYAIRCAVASNAYVPMEALNKLLKDEDYDVKYAAIGNVNLPPNVLQKMIK